MQQSNSEGENPPNKRNRYLTLLTLIFLFLGLLWFALWFFHFRFYETTDDAYANGSMVNLNAVVPGSVTAFYADNTDLVLEGQLLVTLDDTEYRLKYENALANLASVVSQVRQLHASAEVNKKNVLVKKALLSKANYDFDNRAMLVDSKAISDQDFTHSRDDLQVAQLELELAERQLKQSLEAIENTTVENHSLVHQQIAAVRLAYFSLQHCSIYAPMTGFVAQRTIDVGERVAQNSPIMTIIPSDYVWVDANFKETELTHMRIGQPATVWFDIYGSGVQFEGKVLGIASGTGSVFSIIPPQNATGNWIKIVQRLPVRIGLDPKKIQQYPLRLGLSATVKVNITDRTLPMLATIPPSKPVATTKVFNLDFTEVEKKINEIIQTGLIDNSPESDSKTNV